MQDDRVTATQERPEAMRAESDASEAWQTELDLHAVGRVLVRERGYVLRSALVAVALMAVVLLFLKPTYTGKASFLPPNSMSSGSSALLSQLGALGGAGAALGGLKDPSLVYVGMLGSRTVADDMIRRFNLSAVYKTKKLSDTEKELESHSTFVSGKDTIIDVDVEDHDPKRAAAMANAYLDELMQQNDRIAFTEAGQRRVFYEQQLVKEKDLLADAEVELAKSQEQTGLIQPGGQARIQLETIAQTQAEIASREVQLAALRQSATDQNPEVVRLRSEISGLRAQMEQLQHSNAASTEGNVLLPTAKVPALTLEYVRKARDVKYHEALYELLLKQYEAAKLDESRSAPLIQIVDYAVVPDTKSGPHRALMVLAALVVGACFGCVRALARNGRKDLLVESKQ